MARKRSPALTDAEAKVMAVIWQRQTATVGVGDRSLRALLRQANQIRARWALVIGDRELEEGRAALRDLQTSQQRDLPLDSILEELAQLRLS